MQLDVYQERAHATMRPGLSPRDALLDAAAGLAEEAAEVLSHVRKHAFFDRPLDREAVKLELGDALWCLAGVATHLGFSLGDVAAANVAKTADRAKQQRRSGAPTQAPGRK
jgi:NTP pyrophosphatase (non-canonical NTP hydrolase)